MDSREEFSSLMFAVGKAYLTMEGNLVRDAEVPPRRSNLTSILGSVMWTAWMLQSKRLAVAGHPQTPARCLGSLFMGLFLEGGWIESGLTAEETSRGPSTWTPALSKPLLSMSPVHAPNAHSCPLSRLLNFYKKKTKKTKKQANQKPQAGSVCLCPRNQHHILHLLLHSCTCVHRFTLTTADFACVHHSQVGKKPLGNTAL